MAQKIMKYILSTILLTILTQSLNLTLVQSIKYPQFNTNYKNIKFSHDQSFYVIWNDHRLMIYYQTTNLYTPKFYVTLENCVIQDIEFTNYDIAMIVLTNSSLLIYERSYVYIWQLIQTQPLNKNCQLLSLLAYSSYLAISCNINEENNSSIQVYECDLIKNQLKQNNHLCFYFTTINMSATSIISLSSIQSLLLAGFQQTNNMSKSYDIKIYNFTFQRIQQYTIGFDKYSNQMIKMVHFSLKGQFIYVLTQSSFFVFNSSFYSQYPNKLLKKYPKNPQKEQKFNSFQILANDRYFILQYNTSVSHQLKILTSELDSLQNISLKTDVQHTGHFILAASMRKGLLFISDQGYAQPLPITYIPHIHMLNRYSLCPRGYLYNAQHDNCQPCLVNNCNICSTSTSICQSCNPKYFVLNKTCDRCIKGCENCLDDQKCFWCSDEQMINHGNSCQCPQPKVFDQVSNKCKYCMQKFTGCLNCNIDGCQQCDSSKNWMLQDNQCVCSSGFYKPDQGNVCVSCSSNCQSCANSTSCITCQQGYQQVDSKCIDKIFLASFIVIPIVIIALSVCCCCYFFYHNKSLKNQMEQSLKKSSIKETLNGEDRISVQNWDSFR